MRKAVMTFVLLLMTTSGLMAHTINLGYVYKQEGTPTGQQTTGKSTASAAIRIPQTMLKRYAHNTTNTDNTNKIRSVRISMQSLKNLVDSVQVWVRTSIDGENLATGTMTRFKDDGLQSIQTGWNEVALTKAVPIMADTEYYVGYTYYQRTKVCATNYYYRGISGYSYLQLNGEWTEWADGALCIEASIDGTAMPQYDFQLSTAKGTVEANGNITIQACLFNVGQQTGKTIRLNITDGDFSQDTETEADIAPNTFDTLRVTIKDIPKSFSVGSEANITLTAINNVPDEWPEDNNAFCILNYPRLALIEEFTTELCPNCPAMAERLNGFLHGGSEISKQCVMVCHHAGYGTDGFTTQAATDYLWFYNNNGSTYAPAVMFNRKAYQETTEGFTPTTFPRNEEEVMEYAEDCLADPSSIILSSEAKLNLADSTLTLNVTGRMLNTFHITNPRIYVFLTEDNVKAINGQAGCGTEEYYHQHIVRRQNATWGEPLDWDGDIFSYSITFDIQPEWKIGDLRFIASVGNYDSENPANCEIENSTTVKLQGQTSIINTAQRQETKAKEVYYSIDGTRISQPRHGLIFVRSTNGSVRKKVYP